MTNSWTLDRRQLALGFASIGIGLAVPGCATANQAATQSALSWTPTALSPAQANVLDVVAELIIPATDTPGARDAGVPQFVDRAIANYCTPSNAAAVRAGLDRIEADARASYKTNFIALKPDQQVALLTIYDTEVASPASPPAAAQGAATTQPATQGVTPAAAPRAPFFPVLKDLVTVGYFTSQQGATKAVRWDPVPGPYHGCVPLSEIGRAWAT